MFQSRVNHKFFAWTKRPRILYPILCSLLLYLHFETVFSIHNQPLLADEVVTRAVVRIRPQICKIACNDAPESGSGVIIHPHGIILTAWHVTVAENDAIADEEESHYPRFIIDLLDDTGEKLIPTYRAELLADIPGLGRDLALLLITSDIHGNPLSEEQLKDLPYTPIVPLNTANPAKTLDIWGYTDQPGSSGPLHKEEYKILERSSISLTVDGAIEKGHSGGPAFVIQEGLFNVIGIVSTRHLTAPQTYIRGFSALDQLRWRPQQAKNQMGQAWGEQVSLHRQATGIVSLTLDLYTIGNDPVELRFYGFEQGQELVANTTLPVFLQSKIAEGNALVIKRGIQAAYFIDHQVISSTPDITESDVTLLEQLQYQMLVLNHGVQRIDANRQQWHTMTVDPTPTSTPTPTTIPTVPPVTDTPTPATPLPATDTPTPIPPPSATVTQDTLTGRIAFPRYKNGHVDIYVYCLEAKKECYGPLSKMRQADFSNSGNLVVNDEGASSGTLVRMNPTYSNWRNVTKHVEDAYPHWAPNALGVVYASTLFGEDDNSRIYLQTNAIELPDELPNPQPIQYNGRDLFGHHPVYLSNYRVAYQGCAIWRGGGNCGIFSVDDLVKPEREPIQVTTLTDDLPTDNLDSQVLFMSLSRANNWEIYKADTNTRNAIQPLTASPSCDGLATASPNGQYIAFLSDREGPLTVYVMKTGDLIPVRLFTIENAGFGCGDGTWKEERLSWGPP